MKRFLFGLGAIVATIGLGIGLTSPLIAKNVDNFTINSFDAEYHLTKDSDNRSVLRTTEKITVTFPAYDQNHGIERVLPTIYDGHPTRLAVDSVTDETGTELPYSDRNSNDNMVLRIGDADVYAHGMKTYVITYTQHDVTRFFADTNSDELYWDVNGTQWAQQINKVSATVTIDPSIMGAVTGKSSCYQGAEGSSDTCQAVHTQNKFTFMSSRQMQAGENVTFAIGFAPQTFASYQQTAGEKLLAAVIAIWMIMLVIGSIVAVVVIIWMSIVRAKIMNRAKGSGTIIPEYLPPKGLSVLASSQVLGLAGSAITAQLLDLAVRHYIKIYQTKEKKLLTAAEYELEIVKSIDDLSAEERQLIADLFGNKNPKPGTRFAMKKLQSNYSIGQKLTKSRKQLRDKTRTTYNLFEKATSQSKRFNVAGAVLLVAGILTLSPLLIVASVFGFVYAYTLWPLTPSGAERRDYLHGLRLYISVAEEERLRLLQSPEGAEKVGQVKGDNPAQLVKLYERVLPYAVLFGQEKEWMKQLGAYYEAGSQQPDWYAGNGAFNAVMFSSAMSTFSSQSTSYSSPSSSSSGGSGGGGSSGGGGGGGGGGGW